MQAGPDIQRNISLKSWNTFGVDASAEYFAEVSDTDELKEVLRWRKDTLPGLPYLILGGGSNMLLCADFPGLVIKLRLKGKEIQREGNLAYLKLAASENWHEAVLYSLENGFGGMENMALIPGDCGTAPVQNIGAYGRELKDIFYSCNAVNANTLEERQFSLEECTFGYRDSFFKQNKEWVITEVCLRLTADNHLVVRSYGSIESYLKNPESPAPKDIAEAVMAIRKAKLPDPKVTGNAGSFFKNPVVESHFAENLKKSYPEMPVYATDNGTKIPAGWLIEKAGWKGKTVGDAGVHPLQALVLINATGKASGKEIFQLSEAVIKTVKEQFGIELEREVNCFGCV